VNFAATEEFWKNFYDLPPEQKESVREKWQIFREDPFHPSLGTHKIASLSAIERHTIRSVVIEGDLRVIFRIDGSVVTTLDVGTHKIYE
jgi:mRNA-degrading endonuclease RelE of RelBE toxin-antitoxin system